MQKGCITRVCEDQAIFLCHVTNIFHKKLFIGPRCRYVFGAAAWFWVFQQSHKKGRRIDRGSMHSPAPFWFFPEREGLSRSVFCDCSLQGFGARCVCGMEQSGRFCFVP